MAEIVIIGCVLVIIGIIIVIGIGVIPVCEDMLEGKVLFMVCGVLLILIGAILVALHFTPLS